MARGAFAWAATATLSGAGLAEERSDGTFAYDASAFGPDGRVLPERLPLSQPRLENCGFCHGFTARNATSIPHMEVGEVMRCAEKAGWIYNGALIRETVQPAIAGRENLDFPWDVHAAAGIECADCHFSPNNPARRPRADRQSDLNYRPGGDDPGLFLRRPDHNFARGQSPPLTVDLRKRPAMRGCADCHDTSRTHAFLPFKDLHFRRLACQTCHIPAIHFWAYRSQEWLALLEDGGPRTLFRGIGGSPSDPGSEVTGFRPAFILGPGDQFRPVNPISGLFWYDRLKRRPVFTWQLRRAFFEGQVPGGSWRPRDAYLRALDANRDGRVTTEEAILDSPRKVEALASLLWTYGGIETPELRCVVVPWTMSHSIVSGTQAIRSCLDCHGPQSILRSTPALTDTLPPGSRVFYMSQESPVIRTGGGGELVFDNAPLLSGAYILGNSRVRAVEVAGQASVLLVVLGCVGHLLLRRTLGRRP